MKLKVLGGDGSVGIGFQTTSFLINKNVLIDAGSAATSLTFADQRKVDYIFLSHTHLDHIKDICFLADNVFKHRKTPITLVSTPAILEILQKHIFNNLVWPDFSKISNGKCNILAYQPIETEFSVGDLHVSIYPVNHPVPAIGFILRQKKSAIVISGDTGPTEKLWEAANACSGLKAIFTEIAFPNEMEHVAKLAGHFTPGMFKDEVRKIKQNVPFFIYHLKPDYVKVLKKEIQALKVKRLQVIRTNQVVNF